MIVRYSCDENYTYYKDILKQAGFDALFVSPYTLLRSDIDIVLFNLPVLEVESFVDEHPFNNIVVVGSHGYIPSSSKVIKLDMRTDIASVLTHVLNDLIPKSINHSELTADVTKKKKRRWSRKKITCEICGVEFFDTYLGKKSHNQVCLFKTNQPFAYGHMVSVQQPSGKIKGSILKVFIPKSVTVKDVLFKSGFHILVKRDIIKALNAKLRQEFRYVLDKQMFSTQEV